VLRYMSARQDPLFDVNQQVKTMDVCDETSNLRTQDTIGVRSISSGEET
jgi:hypothetical protein